jgi:hypothetical protein
VFYHLDITPSVESEGYFGGIFLIHLHGKGISQAINQHQAGSRFSCLGYSLTLTIKASSETIPDEVIGLFN